MRAAILFAWRPVLTIRVVSVLGADDVTSFVMTSSCASTHVISNFKLMKCDFFLVS